MTAYAGELARLGKLREVDSRTAAAAHLCGLALDAGLVTLPALRAAVDGCRTRGELAAVLRALAAVMVAREAVQR